MRFLLVSCVLVGTASCWAQSSTAPSKGPDTPSTASQSEKSHTPDLSPPRSDRVRADSLESGESSSKDTQIDLSPPPDDDKSHPNSSDSLAEPGVSSGELNEFHPWDPHKAAKDVEVGDFYFKRKNYRAAEDRYREALFYKNNDAVATFRLGVCLEKLDRPSEALQEYQSYLKILPSGPESEQAKKAIERLKDTTANTKPGK